MPTAAGYYRHPTIHKDRIVFVSEDDLWCVPATGGPARRLTASPGAASFPVLSPDGRWIAYRDKNESPFEIYLMSAEGGEPRRRTWFGSTSQCVGWHPDGKNLIVASDWRQPFRGLFHLYLVPTDGGRPQRMDLGPARAISYQPRGDGVVLGRNSGDPARWKRYRGGTAGTLWIDRDGDGEFEPLIRLDGNLASPMWLGSRIYFLSDHEGHGNLYSCTPKGRGLKRHTHHEDFYVRFPATDGKRVVYHAGADIHLFDPATGETRRVEIEAEGPRPQKQRKFVSARRYLESHDLHPQGHSIACVARGAAATMGLWEGPSHTLANPRKARYRLARWLPDGKRLVHTTDENGPEALCVSAADGTGGRKLVRGDLGRPVEIAVAPRGGERAALANHRHELILVEPKTGRSRVIQRSPFARIQGMAWSPDGMWLAFACATTRRSCNLHLYSVATGKVHPITRPEFQDLRPSFDPEGRYLYFISWRDLDPVYDNYYFDLGFPRGSRPYLIPLRRDLFSPFEAALRSPRPPTPAHDEREHGGKKKKKAPVNVQVHLDGIQDRLVAFPVPDGNYERVQGGNGRVFFSSFPIEGSLDLDWYPAEEPDAEGKLHYYDLERDRSEVLLSDITDFSLSLQGDVLGVRVGNRMRVLSASASPKELSEEETPGRRSGWLDLNRIQVPVNPPDEWRQMFLEAWRLQREHFWTPDMSGVDWEAIRERYLPLVDRVTSRSEFSDLLWEMQGELGTSHCYELGGDYRPAPRWSQGFLGADLEYTRRAWRVRRIPSGDCWDARASSPLAAPGANIRVGDEILEVDGQPTSAKVSPDELLVNTARRAVTLTVRRGSQSKRRVTVKTLAEEQRLRYRDWVEGNRERVHRESRGKVGYVHIPNMGPLGYSEFHRYFRLEVDHDGLIVDVRWNGGGHVSQLLLEKLLRRRISYGKGRWLAPEPYPDDAPLGPMVALTNEYAGSDGDIFSHSFKLYKLGPLIGKRTWGGVVGIWPRHALVDGSVTTQAEFAHWFTDVGWGVENYGTDPDIEVEIRPQDHAAGKDTQLDRGLREILAILKKRPPKLPDFPPPPQLAPRPLR